MLTPPDFHQRQVIFHTRTPLALGGTHRSSRCEERPVYLAVENAPTDGLTGSMTLCEECKDHPHRKLGRDYATLYRIKEVKNGN